MTVCFAEFGDAAARAAQRRAFAVIEECRSLLVRSGRSGSEEPPRQEFLTRCVELLRSIDPRLGLRPKEERDGWIVTYADLASRGLAELVSERAVELDVAVGWPAQPLERVAADFLKRTGCDLSGARVRVGFTRGHLLEVVVALPIGLGVSEPELLAEELVERLLGETLVDDWISAIHVTQLPRQGPLRVLAPASSEESFHPLADLVRLVGRATSALSATLPTAPLCYVEVGADWTWLEMESCPGGLQPDRVAAVTWLPELLKSVLEGLPLHSRRFSKCGERFVWIEAKAPEAAQRLEWRERIEREIDRTLRTVEQGALIGTGFGPDRDYFDLCLGPEDAALRSALDCAGRLGLGAGARLGFYDARWAEEKLSIG